MYELVFLPPAQKYFRKLKDKGLRAAYSRAIDKIAADPYIGTEKKGNLAGVFGYDVYHNGTNYEIAYHIMEQDGNYVIIIMVGARENFYDDLKRFLAK